MSSINTLTSKYQRVFSTISDVHGIDPIKDTLVPEILKIKAYRVHEITQDERGAPDLISLREYGTDELWWIMLAYNGIGSYKSLVEGMTLKIPDYSTIIGIVTHQSIRPTSVLRTVTI